jgi:hypothetical protein
MRVKGIERASAIGLNKDSDIQAGHSHPPALGGGKATHDLMEGIVARVIYSRSKRSKE